MTIIASPLLRDHSSTPEFTGGTRLERRAVLDLSIDEEIVRGDIRGAELAEPLRATLTLIVEHELKQEEPLSERELLSVARIGRLFGAYRHRQRIEALVGMNLVRRAHGSVHATVAGISAVLRPSQLSGARVPRDLCRVLRQAELAQLG
jgi:hypothetical protein